ncbi:MAG: hypothetical protein ACRDJX_04660 [Solirubrobacteraceae bacterium]
MKEIMKRIKIIGLALVAVFALSAVVAASASAALPEFVPGAAKTKFTSKSGESFLEASKQVIKCKSDTNKGELVGTTKKEDTVTVTFLGCESLTLKAKCQNTTTKGKIVTNLLVSLLGYINAAKKEVGLSLSPKTAGGLFAEFECAEVKVKVGEGTGKGGNSVIGRVTPVNKLVTPPETFALSFNCVSEKQEVEKFEGGAKDVLEAEIGGLGWEEACESSQDTILFKVAEELKA